MDKTPIKQTQNTDKPRERWDGIPENKLHIIFSKCELVGECLEWQGNYFYRLNGNKSYPYLYYKNKAYRGNRLVMELMGRYIGDKYVLHRCDNQKCLNPDHLYIGTPRQNVMDAIKAGVHASTKIGKDGKFVS